MPTAAPRPRGHPGCGGITGHCPDHDTAATRQRITLLCGPPCSGKTTLALCVAQPGDELLDLDRIARHLGSPHRWLHTPEIVEHAEQIMRSAIRDLRDSDRAAWVIRSLPNPLRRARLARALNARVWILNPGHAECRRRAIRDHRPPGTLTVIRQWYCDYRPSEVDECPPELLAPAHRPGAAG